MAPVEKNPLANAGDISDVGWIPGSGRCPEGGHGNPLQQSGPENPMDSGAWRATVHRVARSPAWLKQLSMHTHTPQLTGFRILERQCSIHTVYFVTFTEELDQSHIIKYLNISSVKCRNGWVLLPNISWRNFQVSEHFLFQSHGLVRYPIL